MDNVALNTSEFARYQRHLIMPEFNLDAQLALKKAKVLVIGAGGLGAPLLQYLAAAGVGTIGIVDFDQIEVSNLQRQVLFAQDDIGKFKAEIAQEKIIRQNPHIEVIAIVEKITSENALEIIAPYDIVADGTDNFPTRYLINDACYLLNKINVFGSIFRFEGQLAVFNYPLDNEIRSANYRDLFPEPPAAGTVPNCAEAGVLGVLPGIVGTMQANEVIKVITGIGEPLINKLLVFDALSYSFHNLKFKAQKDNPLSGENPSIKALIDYEEFCGIISGDQFININSITAKDFENLRATRTNFQLVDVREKEEYDLINLGGLFAPLSKLTDYIDQIDRSKKVIVHCQSGVRSRKAIEQLQKEFGFSNLVNLEGGLNGMNEVEIC